MDVRFAGWSQWLPGEGVTRERSCEVAVEFVEAGTGELRVDGTHYELQAGDAFLLHPGEQQFYRALKGEVFRKMYLCLWPAGCARLLRQLRLHDVSHVRLAEDKAARVKGLFETIVALADTRPEQFRIALSVAAYEILVILSCASHGGSDAPKVPAALARVIAAVGNNVAKQFSVNDLAGIAGCTPTHINRLFKKHTGLHAYEWVQNFKMRHAAEMLRTMPQFSHQVGEAIGYDDPYHFSAAFKRVTGMSPTEYRRRCRHTEQLRVRRRRGDRARHQ